MVAEHKTINAISKQVSVTPLAELHTTANTSGNICINWTVNESFFL
jgi:hypothetical protein